MKVVENIGMIGAENEARNLGCVAMRNYFVMVSDGWGGKKPSLLSSHYFDKNDNELCYYGSNMNNLVIFDKPRVWGESIKSSSSYSVLIDINTYCAYIPKN